jgi:hypothetical protein
MAKTKRKWIVLDYSDPDALRAEDIAYNATTSIKDAIDFSGKGFTGIQGVTGIQGNQGATGAGIAGSTGIQGATGGGAGFGSDIPMLHPDGTHSPTGPLFWDTTTAVTTGLDQLNNLIGLIEPPPGALSGGLVLSGVTPYSAILPTGLNAAWYQGGKVAGNTISGYLVGNTYALASPNPTTAFKCGTISGDIGTISNILTGTLNSSRDVTSGTGTTGNLTITNISTYNTIWRKANAQINYVQPSEGYASHQMTYEASATDQSSSLTEFWYDDVNQTPTFPAGITITEHILSSSRYLSGLRYYSIGDSFDATSSITNVANKAIRPVNPISYVLPGIPTQNISINGATFAYNQIYDYTTNMSLSVANAYSIDAKLAITATKPNGSAITTQSSSQNRLVNTYSPTYSTNCNIYMVDENYRWQLSDNFNVIPGNFGNPTGDWTSSIALSNGNGQIYNGTWWYPNINYTSGYFPAQTANDSTFSGNQVIVWACNIGTAHSSMTFVFAGVTYTDISPVGQGNLNLEIILPTVPPGWLDCGRSFGDGVGCRNDSGTSGSVLALTLGTRSSSDSSGLIFIRATMRSSNCAKASAMTISGT